MLKSYGLYKKVRDASWQILIDNRIDALPVDIIRIATNNEITVLKNSEANELRDGEIGASIYDGNDWYIVYEDKIESIGRKRFTIAHELGHIFLGHPLIAGYHARTININIPSTENEADIFASRLLSPSCVLWGLNLHSAEEIAEVCKISLQSAQIRADRMRVLYKRDKFLISPLEQKVYEQFKEFINGNLSKQ